MKCGLDLSVMDLSADPKNEYPSLVAGKWECEIPEDKFRVNIFSQV